MNIKMDKAKMVTSREYMMKLIYQVNINKQDIKELEMVMGEFFEDNLEYIENRYKELRLQYSNKSELNLDDMNLNDFIDNDYVNSIAKGFKENSEVIDEMIDKNANNWTVNRMPKVDVSILRLAVCEIICENNIPTKVSINEAIELSKEYCDDKGPKFINGILGSVVSELQQ